MGIKHYTALGKQIDIGALAANNSKAVALGNARMNARGDIVGKAGAVIRTQEQIEQEWEAHRQQMEMVSTSANIKAPLASIAPVAKQVVGEADFDPEIAEQEISKPTTTAKRRRIVEAD